MVVEQTWKVDANGDWLNTLEDYTEIVREPSNIDLWVCTKCSYEGEGYIFNV